MVCLFKQESSEGARWYPWKRGRNPTTRHRNIDRQIETYIGTQPQTHRFGRRPPRPYRPINTRILLLTVKGIDLSRNGSLTVLFIAVKWQTFIFDIKTLGAKEILEDDKQNKLMFACRNDFDALWHQFQVKLKGVLDIQLMKILYREREGEFDIGKIES